MRYFSFLVIAVLLSAGTAGAQQIRAEGKGRLIMTPMSPGSSTMQRPLIKATINEKPPMREGVLEAKPGMVMQQRVEAKDARVEARAEFRDDKKEIRGDMKDVRADARGEMKMYRPLWGSSTASSTKEEMKERFTQMRTERQQQLQVLREERKDLKLNVYQERVDGVIARLASFADKQGALILKIGEKFEAAETGVDVSIGVTALNNASLNIETIRAEIKSLDGVLIEASSTTKLATGKTIKETALSVQTLLKENQKLIDEALAVARKNKIIITPEVKSN